MYFHRAHSLFILLSSLLLAASVTAVPAHGQKSGGAAAQGPGAGQAGGQGGGNNAFFETQMLAYGAANELSEAVAKEVCGKLRANNGSTVIIFDQGSFQNLQAWQSFVASANLLAAAYRALPGKRAVVPPEEEFDSVTTPGANSSFEITGGADLAALLGAIVASETQNAAAFTIQDSSMAVSISHQLLKACKEVSPVYYPLFGGNVDPEIAIADLMEAMNELNKARTDAIAIKQPSDLMKAALNDLNGQYDLLLKSIFPPSTGMASPNAGNGQSMNTPGSSGQSQASTPVGITSVLQGAALQHLIRRPKTYILYASVAAAGGTQRVKKNLLTILFTGDWISYSGGLIVNVALIDALDVSLVFADTLRYRTDFTHIKRPQESSSVESTNVGDNEESLCNEESYSEASRHAPNKCLEKRAMAPGNTRVSISKMHPTPVKNEEGKHWSVEVELDGPPPADGAKVVMWSSVPDAVDISPKFVRLLSGNTRATFDVKLKRPLKDQEEVIIHGKYNGTLTLTLDP